MPEMNYHHYDSGSVRALALSLSLSLVSRRRWMNSFARSSAHGIQKSAPPPPEMMMIPCEMARNAPCALHAQRIITAFLSAAFFNPIVAATAAASAPCFSFSRSLSQKAVSKIKIAACALLCHRLRDVMYGIPHECLTHDRFTWSKFFLFSTFLLI
jgi:hypothetical protein